MFPQGEPGGAALAEKTRGSKHHALGWVQEGLLPQEGLAELRWATQRNLLPQGWTRRGRAKPLWSWSSGGDRPLEQGVGWAYRVSSGHKCCDCMEGLYKHILHSRSEQNIFLFLLSGAALPFGHPFWAQERGYQSICRGKLREGVDPVKRREDEGAGSG